MNSTNFNRFIEDFSSIDSSDSSSFERILRKFPYFQTAALFLAKANPIQHHTQTAALRSADRRVLRSWLDDDYRKEVEREKQETEAKQVALEKQKDKNNESFKENLDINTESINAFDKLVGTSNTPKQAVKEKETILEENKDIKSKKTNSEVDSIEEIKLQKNEVIENEYKPTTSFFDEIEDQKVVIKKETIETKIDSSNFFDEIEEVEEKPNQPNELIFKEQSDINEPLITPPISQISEEISNQIPAQSTDANFFDEIEDMKEYPDEPIFKEQSDINQPLLNQPLLNQPSLEISKEIPAQTTDANFFDEIDDMVEYPDEPIFKEQSDINQPLLNAPISDKIPAQSTDANFFDEIDDMEEYPNEPIFKEQSDINAPLLTQSVSEIPAQTTDTNFFDAINDMEEYPEEPIFREQSDINQPLITSPVSEISNEVPIETMDANFFDEIEGDDQIFGDAQKDLDNYDFPDFKDEKKEIDKNKKANENKKEDEEEGSFFDGI